MSNTHIHVPASKDTLFMRGFSCRQDIDQIREFFAEKSGRNTVEFFKEDGNNQLFLALRFESKDVAKEVLHRFNDTEILGNRISMTWYKDLRRARPYNEYRRQSFRGGNFGADQYDYRNSYQRSGYQKSHYPPASSGRMRKYSRSSSRSRSNTRSPSPSRSRSRSSSKSYDSRDFRKKRDISGSINRKSRLSSGKKRAPVEGGHPRGYESSDSQNSAGISPIRTSKKLNASENVDAQQSSPQKRGKQPPVSAKAPQSDHEQAAMDLEQCNEGADYSFEISPQASSKLTGRGAVKSSVQKKIVTAKVAEEKQPLSEWIPVDMQAGEAAATQAASKKPAQPSQLSAPREQSSASQSKEMSSSMMTGKQTGGSSALRKNTVDDRKVVGYDEDRSDVEDDTSNSATFQQSNQQLHNQASRNDNGFGNFSAQSKLSAQKMSNKPTKESAANMNAEQRMPPSYEQVEATDSIRASKKRKSLYDHGDDLDVEQTEGTKQPRYDLYEDVANSRKSKKASGSVDFNPTSVRSLMGISHEKMIIIKEKKEEVEKAYRQDCDTFATVTKLLISKDPELEDRIQSSLRENLRDIGHRCIQELRDFVDRIKSEDDL